MIIARWITLVALGPLVSGVALAKQPGLSGPQRSAVAQVERAVHGRTVNPRVAKLVKRFLRPMNHLGSLKTKRLMNTESVPPRPLGIVNYKAKGKQSELRWSRMNFKGKMELQDVAGKISPRGGKWNYLLLSSSSNDKGTTLARVSKDGSVARIVNEHTRRVDRKTVREHLRLEKIDATTVVYRYRGPGGATQGRLRYIGPATGTYARRSDIGLEWLIKGTTETHDFKDGNQKLGFFFAGNKLFEHARDKVARSQGQPTEANQARAALRAKLTQRLNQSRVAR